MAAETQIMVVKDDFFLLLWQQPAEEQIQRPVSFTGPKKTSNALVSGLKPTCLASIGWSKIQKEGGYWAWGCLVQWRDNEYYGVKLGCWDGKLLGVPCFLVQISMSEMMSPWFCQIISILGVWILVNKNQGYVPRSHLAVQKEDSPDAVAERPEVPRQVIFWTCFLMGRDRFFCQQHINNLWRISSKINHQAVLMVHTLMPKMREMLIWPHRGVFDITSFCVSYLKTHVEP